MIRIRRHSAGFTLIEAIIVIVITGILAGIVAVFISKPVEGYVDSVRRAELTDAADVALRRIARDVRLALPNTLRLKNASNNTVVACAEGVECYIEFIITKDGGRYRSESDGSDCSTAKCLSFTSSTSEFDVLGSMPVIAVNDWIVVYNLGPDNPPVDDTYYSAGNHVQVDPTWSGSNPIKLTAATQNVFSSQSPPLPSPSGRFQVVGSADRVVRYRCANSVVDRFANCNFTDTATGCSGPARLVGDAGVAATCSVDFTSNATGRSGLLYVKLKLTSGGETVELFNQIHVDNSP